MDKGPWLRSSAEAEEWAAVMRKCGYRAHVEGMDGHVQESSPDADLRSALGSMA